MKDQELSTNTSFTPYIEQSSSPLGQQPFIPQQQFYPTQDNQQDYVFSNPQYSINNPHLQQQSFHPEVIQQQQNTQYPYYVPQ